MKRNKYHSSFDNFQLNLRYDANITNTNTIQFFDNEQVDEHLDLLR